MRYRAGVMPRALPSLLAICALSAAGRAESPVSASGRVLDPSVHLERRHREAMGTHFTLTVADPLPVERIDRAASEAFDEVERIEARIS